MVDLRADTPESSCQAAITKSGFMTMSVNEVFDRPHLVLGLQQEYPRAHDHDLFGSSLDGLSHRVENKAIGIRPQREDLQRRGSVDR